MSGLPRPALRKVIETLFQSKPATAFKTEFLQDYYPKIYRDYAGENSLMALVTTLFEIHYGNDGSAILGELERYFTPPVVAAAMQTVSQGPSPSGRTPPEPVPASETRRAALVQMQNAYALVIGIGRYRQLGQLNNTTHDAQDIAQLLTDREACGYPAGQVTALLDEAADRAGILLALDALARRTNPESTVFIFAACHGGTIAAGPLAGEYLLPVDVLDINISGAAAFAQSAISGSEFSQAIARIPSRKLVIALDCCHSEGIADLRSVSADVAVRSGLSASYYQKLASSGRGRAILAAAMRDQTSKELRSDRNGLFTKHLLAGLRGAGGGTDAFVRILDLYDYVERMVSATVLATPQNPILKADIQSNFPIAVRGPSYFSSGSGLGTPRDAGPAPSYFGAPPAASRRCDRGDLVDGLLRMLESQFDMILFSLNLQPALLPSQKAPQAERAIAVLRLLEQQGEPRLAELGRLMHRHAPGVLSCQCE